MARNPKFDRLLAQMAEIHNRKNHDYAKAGNPYSNFEDAAVTAGCSVDTVFAVLIGIKLARLKELLSSGKGPANESVQDTRMDLAVYAALWASYGAPEGPVTSDTGTLDSAALGRVLEWHWERGSNPLKQP